MLNHYWLLLQQKMVMVPVSEMTYTTSSGTLNSTIPYGIVVYHVVVWYSSIVKKDNAWSQQIAHI